MIMIMIKSQKCEVGLTSGAQADHLAGFTVSVLADGKDTEVVERSTRRRTPQVRRLVGWNAGAERHPLSHCSVLDDVVVDWDAAGMPRCVPLDQQARVDLLNADVERRCRPRT